MQFTDLLDEYLLLHQGKEAEVLNDYGCARYRIVKKQINQLIPYNKPTVTEREIDEITTNIQTEAQRRINAIHNCERSMAEGAECQCGNHEFFKMK